MKRLFLLLLLVVTAVAASAQSRMNTYIARMRVPEAMTGAKVVVMNDHDVAAGLYTAPDGGRTVGYRICIFFDNTQNGRALANGALASFKERFPGIPGQVIYANPTFKTMVGYCLDMNEASMLLGRVHESFPSAVLVREESMPLANLMQSPVSALPMTDSTTLETPLVEEAF